MSDGLQPGQHSFRIECNQGSDIDWDIRFDQAALAAVAISPN